MADKAISELISATGVNPQDLFVLEQSGTAKKLTGQVLENWLVSFANGHGGIHSIAKVSTSGLVDTYRITLADQTTYDFEVANGKSVNSITKTGSSGLVDTYSINYNDGTTGTFTVTNGAKGDKGDDAYIWIKYASQEPTEASHSFGDIPDDWIGIYVGRLDTAPDDWAAYNWFQIKGEKGDTGEPATVTGNVVEYQVGDSGTIIPSGAWGSSVPVVPQGKYLWTRTTTTFNSGSAAVSYSVSRMGLDGAGSVSSVANISPDANGNVPLAAENINALPANGGTMYGGINMSGHTISGLNAPTANDQAANMGFVNQQVKNAGATNVLVNSYFANPVNPIGSQIYEGAGNTIAEWDSSSSAQTVTVKDGCIEIAAGGSSLGIIHQIIPERFSKYMRGKVYTLAVCDDDGLVQVASGVCTEEDVSSNTSVFVTSSSDKLWYANLYKLANEQLFDLRINVKKGSTCRFKWAGLYPGEHTAETLREYQPKGYGVEVVNCNGGALSTELLWENGSPSDSFVAQDIATADVGHNFIMIEFRASSSSSTYALSPFIRTNNKTVPFDYFTNSGALQRRRVKVSKTNISFEKGLLNNSEDNSLMIPIRIYAIKGASV